MRVEPLPRFPVVRDLVVDFAENEAALVRLRPLLVGGDDSYTSFPEPVTHDEMRPHFDLTRCIDCRICVASCSVLRDDPESDFVGPYALVQLAKVALHPRFDDPGLADRVVASGIEQCHSCNDCTNACPCDVPVLTGAIDPLREVLVREGRYRIHFWWIIQRMPGWLRSLLRCRLWPPIERLLPRRGRHSTTAR
jgi:succinate dehydrogenase / fumarate reductase iron-sulfur subunit